MERSFQDIMFLHEREDNAAARSECELLNAVRGEFANADRLISKAREKGFSLSAFFSGEPLPADLPLPVRRSEAFYVKKHTSAQQPYLHAHEFYELLYVQSGACMQTLRNGRGVSLQKGQCCLIRPGEAHRIGRVGKVDVILKAVIPGDLFLRAADRIPLPEGGLVVFGRLSLFAEYLFLRLLRESTLRGLCHEAAICALLSLLFCELARGEAKESAGSLPFYGEYFENELKSASLTHFARSFGYTPAYASRLVKRQTGKSFLELLSGYRMQRAAELLSSSDLSVEDIALEIGYQVPFALYKQFSAHFGMMPNEYRNALQSG